MTITWTNIQPFCTYSTEHLSTWLLMFFSTMVIIRDNLWRQKHVLQIRAYLGPQGVSRHDFESKRHVKFHDSNEGMPPGACRQTAPPKLRSPLIPPGKTHRCSLDIAVTNIWAIFHFLPGARRGQPAGKQTRNFQGALTSGKPAGKTSWKQE